MKKITALVLMTLFTQCQAQKIQNVMMSIIDSKTEKFKEILIKEGWYSEDQLEIKKNWQGDVENQSFIHKALVGMYLKGLVGTKQSIRNTYDKIPLNIMFHYSKQFGVKYQETKIQRNYAINDCL